MNINGQRLRFLLLMAASFFLFTLGSWQLPFLGPDEPRYAQVARQMLESGNYVVPYLGSHPWLEKPVLLYWLMAASYSLLGVTEFAARLPSALAALGSVLIIYLTVSKILDARRGFLCGLILATSTFFVGFSHAATFDMLLTLFVTAALCSFALYRLDPSRRHFLYLMYLATGLGILAKGFVALILVGLPVFVHLLWERQWKDIFAMEPLQGLLILIGVVSAWFVPMSMISGDLLWDEFIYQHHFVRYLSDRFHRTGTVFYYFPMLLLGTYPWSMAPFARWKLEPGRERGLVKLAGWWMILTVLFFTVSRSKLPGYILPIAPAFAILAAVPLTTYLERETSYRRMVVLLASYNAIVMVAVLWGAEKFQVSGSAIYWICAVVIALTSLGLFLATLRKFASAVLCSVLIVITLMAGFIYILPQPGRNDSRNLCLQVRDQLQGGDKLLLYNVYDFSTLFYLDGRVELTPEGYFPDISDYRELYSYVSRSGRAFVMVGNPELSWIQSVSFWRVARITRGERISIVELHSIPTKITS